EERLVIDLEANVVRHSAAKLRDLPQEPVRETIRCEHSVSGPQLVLYCGNRARRPVVLEPRVASEEQRARGEKDRPTQTSTDGGVETSPGLGGPTALEPPADRYRHEHHAGEGEPRNPANRSQRADERQGEDGDVEPRQALATPDDEWNRHRREN